MSNQTFVKKDRISFAQNFNEIIVLAPSNNNLFIGPNSAINYDKNSNITNIQTLQGVTLSNQYIYADGTFLSNIPTSSNWSQYPALSQINYSNNNTVSNIFNEYTDITFGPPSGLSNVLMSFNSYFSYFNPIVDYPTPIAADWSRFNAICNVDLSGFGMSNINFLGFYDSNVIDDNVGLYYQNSLLYYNSSNEIIGGTLHYLPQFISFVNSPPPPVFDPTQIPYLGLWMDAADVTTFVIDSGSILQWYDKSSNSNIFIPNNYPSYNVSNVTFDGTYFMASSNNLSFDTNTYIFIVDSLSNNGNPEMIFAFNDIFLQDYSLRYYAGLFNDANSNDALFPTYYANGISNGIIDYTQRHIVDGSLNMSGTSIMRLSSDFMGRYYAGNMNEVIIYNGPTEITNDQITQVRNYLSNKWSIV